VPAPIVRLFGPQPAGRTRKSVATPAGSGPERRKQKGASLHYLTVRFRIAALVTATRPVMQCDPDHVPS
jgi:hypothetical protein